MIDVNSQKIRNKIINILTNKYIKNIVITFHAHPDGDAIGSAVAFALALQQLNKNIDILVSTYSTIYTPLLKNINMIRKPKRIYDICLLLDCSDERRVSVNINNIAKLLIVIDHHIFHYPIGNLYWIENYASTTIMIYKILKNINININKEIATALYLGIFSDTGGFTNANVNSYVLHQAAELISYGANLELINQICTIKTLSMLKLMGQLFNQIIYDSDYKIVYMVLLREDLKKYKLNYDITDHLINELKNIQEANIAYLFIESNKILLLNNIYY